MLTQNQIDIIIKAMKPFNPTKIGVFGSVARNEATVSSDIDILYSFNSKYSLFDLAGLQIELMELLKKNVDLVEFTAIHPRLRDRILTDAKIFYGTKGKGFI